MLKHFLILAFEYVILLILFEYSLSFQCLLMSYSSLLYFRNSYCIDAFRSVAHAYDGAVL